MGRADRLNGRQPFVNDVVKGAAANKERGDRQVRRSHVKMQTEAHKQAVGLFDKYGKEGDDAALVP
jgi:hypothetical protein